MKTKLGGSMNIFKRNGTTSLSGLAKATVSTLAVTMLMAVSHPVFATTIEQSIEAAIGQSQKLEAERQKYISIRQSLGLATASNDLQANLVIKGSNTSTDRNNSTTSATRTTATISLSKQIYDSGETEASLASARNSISSAEANFSSVEQQLIFEVISAHLSVITSTEQFDIQKTNAKRLQAHTQAARIRLENGSSTPTRVAEAEARLARAQSDLIEAEASLASAKDEFNSLTGLPAENLSRPNMPVNLPESLSDAEKKARIQHPSIIAAELAVKAASNEFEVLKRSVLPKVKLSLSYAQTKEDTSSNDKNELSSSVELRTPFLVTNAVKAKDKELAAKSKQMKFRRDDAVRTTALGVRTAYRSYRASIAQQKAVKLEYQAAKLVDEGTASEVEFGMKTFLDQLDSEKALLDASLRVLTTDQAVQRSAYQLLLAMGELTTERLALELNFLPLDLISDPESRYTLPVPITRGE